MSNRSNTAIRKKGNQNYEEIYNRINTILVSQPKPERSPYYDIEKKYGLQIDWRPFIHVEGVSEKEFRKNRIRPDDYTAVIFTSRNAIENYFRICKEMRIKVNPDMKYFCVSEAVAYYLQKFILYRKRKVFVGNKRIDSLINYFNKHKEKEKFLLPCSNLGAKRTVEFLKKENIEFTEVVMYKTLSSDLSDLSDVTYDVLVFFSPQGIESLYENFPDFKQNDTRMAVFGNSTIKAVEDKGLYVNIAAPTKENPSMAMALESYLKRSNKS